LLVDTMLPMDGWSRVADVAKTAEAIGFDGVKTNELKHDPFAPLVLASVATERVQLSTGIVVCFPRSPMVVANIARDIHAASGGRFHLGLGSQVKGHNERRYSVPWTPPQPRMREYVQALRAIWRAWEEGEKLRFEGEHYNFTLMTPEFTPPKTGLPMFKVSIAAVGEAMLRLSGQVCDGVRLHGFCTRKYTEEVALKHVGEGLARSGRSAEDFEIIGGGFVATGPDEQAVRERMDWVRYRVAFYGSTRTYHGVFAVHGLDDLGHKLHRMSLDGKWNEMAKEVPDDVVRLFAAIGTYDELPKAIEERFGGIADSISLDFPPGTDPDLQRDVLARIRRIPGARRAKAA
jgi:probable F420-dependent oxidoreductase